MKVATNSLAYYNTIMRRIVLTVVFGLAFMSCSKDIVKDVNDGHPIEFHVFAQTRANNFTTANLSTFYVTALYGDNAYFEDLSFSRSDNDVFISPVSYYWPNGTLDFFAYAPSEDELGGTLDISKDKSLKGFSPKTTFAAQNDFIVATKSGSKSDFATTKSVPLKFEHQLSQIEVRAKNNHTGYKYEVAGVRISNVVSKADFSFAPAEGSPCWTPGTEKYSYELTYAESSPITIGSSGTDNLMGEASCAMLIPQDLSASGMNASIDIFVRVTAKSSDEIQIFPESGNYGWMTVPIENLWEPGCRYVYTLDLSNTSALGDPISFTLEKFDWTEKSTMLDSEIDIRGLWQLTRIEFTYKDLDGTVQNPNGPDVKENKEKILEHIDESLYIIKVTDSEKYWVYPGQEGERCYTYKILDGILTVYIPFLDDPDKTDKMEFMVRDVSSTQVTYVKENQYVDNGENSRYYLDSVFYYDKIGDI